MSKKFVYLYNQTKQMTTLYMEEDDILRLRVAVRNGTYFDYEDKRGTDGKYKYPYTFGPGAIKYIKVDAND